MLFAEIAKNLKELITGLDEESSKVELRMNTEKTKIMTNGQVQIKVKDKHVEYADQYIYLGKQTPFSKHNEQEVERRITTDWKRYWSQKEILKGNYSLNLKDTVMGTCILPSLL